MKTFKEFLEENRLDEISDKTLKSYVSKAREDLKKKKSLKRTIGIQKAIGRYDPSEVSDLDMGKYSSSNMTKNIPKSYTKRFEPEKKKSFLQKLFRK